MIRIVAPTCSSCSLQVYIRREHLSSQHRKPIAQPAETMTLPCE